jgi:hypothetical protein
MISFTEAYLKPDGTFPHIGDSDGGKVLPLDGGSPSHAAYLSVADWLSRENGPRGQNGSPESAFWLTWTLRKRAIKLFRDDFSDHKERRQSGFFPKGGFLIMRDDGHYFCIGSGDPDGVAPASHLHNDLLSFELSIGSRNFIVDSGTFAYTSSRKWRAYFRHPLAHNTLVPAHGARLSIVDLDSPFPIDRTETVNTRINRCLIEKEFDYFDAEHDLFYPLVQRRTVFFDKREKCWILSDTLTGNGTMESELCFHFYPQSVTEFSGDGPVLAIHTAHRTGVNLCMLFDSVTGHQDRVKVRLQEGWYSPLYGQKEKNTVTVFESSGPLPHEFRVLLIPFSGTMEDAYSSIQGKRETILSNFRKHVPWGDIGEATLLSQG